MTSKKRARGAALMTALFVVALAALLVSGLLWRQHVQIRRLENQRLMMQARWVERSALDWIRLTLRALGAAASVDYLGGVWAVPLAPTHLSDVLGRAGDAVRAQAGEDTELSGWVEDAQAKFNLRNLVGASASGQWQPDIVQIKNFQRLLSILKLEPELANAAAAHLRAALAERSAVNFNTARGEVIASLFEGLGLANAQTLAEQREQIFFCAYGRFCQPGARDFGRAASTERQCTTIRCENPFFDHSRAHPARARAARARCMGLPGPRSAKSAHCAGARCGVSDCDDNAHCPTPAAQYGDSSGPMATGRVAVRSVRPARAHAARRLRNAHASAQGADHYSVDCRARSAAAERSACAALQSAAARRAAECGGRSTGAGRAELPYCAGANAGAAIRIQTQASVHAPACHHRPGLVPVYTHGFY